MIRLLTCSNKWAIFLVHILQQKVILRVAHMIDMPKLRDSSEVRSGKRA